MSERARPTGLLRLFYKVPTVFYRIGLAGPVGRTFLLLVTRGRHSGRPRYTGLNYAEDGSAVYVMSGYGARTDWYRNLVADPHVEVRIGRHRFAALATTVTDPMIRRRGIALLLKTAQRQGPPAAIRPILAKVGFDYERELATMDRDAPGMPLVVLEPF